MDIKLTKDEKDKFDREIANGDLDIMLDNANCLAITIPRSSIIEDTSKPKVQFNNNKSKQVEVSNETTFDDILNEIEDCCLDSIVPKTPRKKYSLEPETYIDQQEFQSNVAGAGFFAQPKFCKALEKEMEKDYSVQIHITTGHDKTAMQNLIYIVDIKSTNKNKVDVAKKALNLLFGETIIAIKLLDQQKGLWTKYPKCADIIQAYALQNDYLHILCEYSEIGLMISYFNKDKSNVLLNLCTTDKVLDTIIKDKFCSVEISLPSTSDLTQGNRSHLAQDILKVENEMQSKEILIILEQRLIYLFGLTDSVKDIEKRLNEIKGKYASDLVKLYLDQTQIRYLLNVCKSELKTLETDYQNTKILETIENGEFTAPKYLHDILEKKIIEMATLCSPMYVDIQQEAFHSFAHDECPKLIEIGQQHKCQIDIQQNTKDYLCEIPKAAAKDHISDQLTASAITIHKDDLAEEKVDLVVVCTTSGILCNSILDKAGPPIRQEYIEGRQQSPTNPFETNSGLLKCRKLLFLPWNMDQSSNEAFYRSIRDFVAKAVKHAIRAHHTSIAFPAIGCGLLNFDKNTIATQMLIEAQKQLMKANVLLQIIFAILPTQNEVYDIFQSKLDRLQKGNVETKRTHVPYRLTTLSITILSSNTENQEQCSKALTDHIEQSSKTVELLQQDTLKKWTQPVIDEFYTFCAKRQVLIDMNITIGFLKFSGSKEAVSQVETEYHKQQAKQIEQAHFAAITRDVVWAYKIDEKTSEKYSADLNGRIEAAHLSKVLTYEYTSKESKQYRIDFSKMMETCLNDQTERQVVRHDDFHLPEYWEVQSENVAQFSVKVDCDEYRKIYYLFHQTMANKYTQIIQIDRIQNKQWYMQYSSLKKFSPKKDTEKTLFHGCARDVAALIVRSFFNRSFAGVNGIVYGQGAYFSSKAVYSHGFTRPNSQTGERCMFVVNVLVGDSALGNPSMKTPPPGFDSTTDGNHIFVTYRDDQAYASYLIIYK